MGSELEARLEAVPPRWRDATRVRAYAVMDYLNAGDDGPLLVDVLCRRTELTRSAFYALVRRWRASGGDPAALAPWARRTGAEPRIPRQSTAHIDAFSEPLLAQDPERPTEPMAQQLLADWPADLFKPGVSYVRRRIGQVRTEQQKKTRRARVGGDDDGEPPPGTEPEARWPLDVLVIDHVAVEVVVWDGDEATLPLVSLVVDLATREPVAVVVGVDAPSPARVASALADLARAVADRAPPGPPTILLSTTFGRGWPELTTVIKGTGANVIAKRSRKLRFGGTASRLLEGELAGNALAPRVGHRSADERIGPQGLATLPNMELEDFVNDMESHVASRRAAVATEMNWPPAARQDALTWRQIADLSVE